jgi:site-specific DNA-methyltransferase (cytosine-N4-specific)
MIASVLEDVVTTQEAAEMLERSRERVLQFIREGRLEAEKRGRDYLIPRYALAQFASQPRKRTGRPKKKVLVQE